MPGSILGPGDGAGSSRGEQTGSPLFWNFYPIQGDRYPNRERSDGDNKQAMGEVPGRGGGAAVA